MEQTMIDIHTHMVPNVDDGSENMDMSKSMMITAYLQNVRELFVTPHSSAFRDHPQETEARIRQLRIQADDLFGDLQIYTGCEVMCDISDMPQTLTGLAEKKYPSMNGTRFVLAEFDRNVVEENALACLEALIGAGWKPIVAHVELYPFLRDMALVNRFREMGCKLQLNAEHLFDAMDERSRQTTQWARTLVQEKKIDFLGTDAHNSYNRPPSVERGLQWLYTNAQQAYADSIAFGNARYCLIEKQEETL